MIKRGMHIDPTISNGYIPAPYELEEGDDPAACYLEPVTVRNEHGPAVSTVFCGIIIEDGCYFKDMDNDGVLSPYEDWRRTPEERAADMVRHLRLDQQAGLVFNTLHNNPQSLTRAEAAAADGSIPMERVIAPAGAGEEGPTIFGLRTVNDNADITERKVPGGVYRKHLDPDASMIALYHNAATELLEYEACRGGVAVPYTLHTNPINIGYPDQLGMGAAVMGDGSAAVVEEMAAYDRTMMRAAGLMGLYGPQVDIATDPRWPRTSGTYGEVPEVTERIATALVHGYQHGAGGLDRDAVTITVKHFPGDGPAENGFEPHMPIGQWRLYPTAGSLERYHLRPFQAAFDAGASAIMPDYSRVASDGRSVPQTYRGHDVSNEELPSAYNAGLLGDLARDTMGFTGYVNSDSGIITAQAYGLEDRSLAERYAIAISAGTDIIGGEPDPASVIEAVQSGLLPKEDLDRANYRRLLSLFRMERVDNPYLDLDAADRAREENLHDAQEAAYRANQHAVVLAKNHERALPMAPGATVCIRCMKGVDPGLKVAEAMGATAGGGDVSALTERLAALFEARGFTVVDTPDEADYTYVHAWPILNNTVFHQRAMPVIELVDNLMVEAREENISQRKTGERIAVSTLRGVDDLPAIAEAAHAHGGKVIATLVVTSPWILTALEPYVDALTFQYTVSAVAQDNALGAQLDVLTGAFNPTGKMCLTMVSSPEVIAIEERLVDGVVREICASPNDVPGYEKDAYIAPEVLERVPGGSYAYQDADGNYYRAGFGLAYGKDR